MSDGRVVLDVVGNAAPFKRTMSALPAVAAGIGKKVAGLVGVVGLAAFSKSCVSAASAAQQTANRVATVFPQMQAQVNAFASTAMEKMGMSAGQAKSLTSQFGMMAQGMGFTEKSAAEMSTTMAQMAGDMAAFYGISAEEAQSKLSGVFTGMTRGLKSVGVNMSEANLQQHAFTLGISKSVSDMNDAELAALRLSYAHKQLAFTSGYAQKNLGTWAGQTNLLNQQMGKLRSTIGKALIAALLPALKVINAVIGGLVSMAETFNRAVEQLTGVKLDSVLGGAQAAAVDLSDSTDDASDSTADLARQQYAAEKAAKKQAKAQKALNKALAGFDQINKLASKQKDESTSSDTGVDTGLGLANQIAAASDFGDIIAAQSDTAQKALDKLALPPALVKAFESLKKVAGEVSSLISDGLKWAYDNVLVPLGKWTVNEALPTLMQGLADAIGHVRDFAKSLSPYLDKLVDVLGGAFKKVWDNVLVPFGNFAVNEVLPRVLEAVGTAFGVIVTVLEKLQPLAEFILDEFLTPLANLAGELVKKALDALNSALKWLLEQVEKADFEPFVESLKGIKDAVGKAFTDALEAGKNAIEALCKAWDAVNGGVKTLTATVSATLSAAWETVKGAFATAAGWAASTVRNVAATVTSAVDSAWSTAKSAFEWAAKGVKDIAGTVTGSVKATVSKLWDKAESAFSWAAKGVKNFTGTVTGKVKATVSKAWNSAKKGFKWAKDGLFNKFRTVQGTISVVGANLWKSLKDKWNWAKKYLKKDIVGKIAISLSNIAGSFKTWINNNIIKPLNGLLNGIRWPTGLDGKRGYVFGHANPIPRLAQGGWVSRNTPKLAVIGDNRREGEIVSPESKLQAMADEAARNGGSDMSTVEALLRQLIGAVQAQDRGTYLDGREITRAVVRNINNQTQATGKCPVVV